METTEIIRTIVQEFPYALYGSILVGILCAFIGVYVVTKRIVFLGAVLTQVSVLGIAITFIPFFAFMSHSIGSLILTLVTVIIFARMLSGKKIPKDALLGVSFITTIALRILIMQKTPKVEVSEIENLLRGDILFITPELFYGMLIVFIVVLIIHLLFFKEFNYISFDAETARTQRFNAGLWDILFYVTAGIVISVATHMVGDTFVFGFLVIPATTALLLTKKVKAIYLYAVIIGVISPIIGLFLAFKFDFPTSPAIVAVAGVLLACAWMVNLIRKQ